MALKTTYVKINLILCFIRSGDELLLTEMIFNGVFNDLTVQQCVALLSCFVFEEKVRIVLYSFTNLCIFSYERVTGFVL